MSKVIELPQAEQVAGQRAERPSVALKAHYMVENSWANFNGHLAMTSGLLRNRNCMITNAAVNGHYAYVCAMRDVFKSLSNDDGKYEAFISSARAAHKIVFGDNAGKNHEPGIHNWLYFADREDQIKLMLHSIASRTNAEKHITQHIVFSYIRAVAATLQQNESILREQFNQNVKIAPLLQANATIFGEINEDGFYPGMTSEILECESVQAAQKVEEKLRLTGCANKLVESFQDRIHKEAEKIFGSRNRKTDEYNQKTTIDDLEKEVRSSKPGASGEEAPPVAQVA